MVRDGAQHALHLLSEEGARAGLQSFEVGLEVPQGLAARHAMVLPFAQHGELVLQHGALLAQLELLDVLRLLGGDEGGDLLLQGRLGLADAADLGPELRELRLQLHVLRAHGLHAGRQLAELFLEPRLLVPVLGFLVGQLDRLGLLGPVVGGRAGALAGCLVQLPPHFLLLRLPRPHGLVELRQLRPFDVELGRDLRRLRFEGGAVGLRAAALGFQLPAAAFGGRDRLVQVGGLGFQAGQGGREIGVAPRLDLQALLGLVERPDPRLQVRPQGRALLLG